MINETKLQEIEARCNAADPGPWTWTANHVLHRAPYVGAGEGGGRYVCTTSIAADSSGVRDAKFIAAARTDIPLLIAALREANGLCGELAEALKISHDAMVNWFSSEYANSPKAKLIREALDKYYDYRKQV